MAVQLARIVFRCSHCSVPLDFMPKDSGSISESLIGQRILEGMRNPESLFGCKCKDCCHKYSAKIIEITYPPHSTSTEHLR